MPTDNSLWSTLIMIGLMVAAFYYLIIRPARRRSTEQQNLVSSLAPGSRIMTTAGVFGTIKHLGETQAIIEIAPDIEMTITKQAIMRQVSPSEEEFEYADEGAPEHTDVLEPDVLDTDEPAVADESATEDPQTR